MAADAFDYVVVGAGLAGPATAWQLAARGHEVAIVERSVPANDAGSSHGSARIFRYAYPDPFYTGLVVQARDGWDQLEALAGRQLITPTGSLDFGSTRDPEGIAAVLAGAGVEHELLTPAEAGRRWPQIRFDTSVLWHPGAGVIDAHTAVETMVDLAVEQGAQLLTHWPVAAVREHGAGYRLVSADGDTLEAGNLVISAGGWLPQLLGQLPLPEAFRAQFPALQVRQENAYHFPYREQPGPEGWPTFIHKTDGIQTYSLPGGRDAGFRGQKLAEYNAGRILPSAADQDGTIDPANRERVIDYVRKHLPGLEPEPYAETTCLFTNTPDEDFVIDRARNITVLSPCSGHGAKFAPLLGRLAADLAAGEGPVPKVFRPSLAEGARL